jgi:hypothetical protein
MLTFTAIEGGGIKLTGGGRTLIVFPKSARADKDALTLLPSPQEEPKENVISWPGEYNESGISIRGVGHKEGQQVSHVVTADHVRIAFLSSPLQDWTDNELESIPDIDVLMLPSDDAKIAQKLIDEMDPRILFVTPGDDHADVVKLVAPKESVDEFKLKGSLPAEGREVMVLEA